MLGYHCVTLNTNTLQDGHTCKRTTRARARVLKLFLYLMCLSFVATALRCLVEILWCPGRAQLPLLLEVRHGDSVRPPGCDSSRA